ncbi:MAG TPA: DUF6520 family protein [Cyclobacteriaceae bacterium]|nr:DUF6520 family protein [Cyclobacteriaceae bacterium]
MKKFRMMLPVVAVVFAVVGAIAGDLLPTSQGYHPVTGGCSSKKNTDQQCFTSANTMLPLCTITVNNVANQAFNESDCTGILRYNP